MAHLSNEVIDHRREIIYQFIVAMWEVTQEENDADLYALHCPCYIDCFHMSIDDVPRIYVPFCLYPGELDFFIATQPFHQEYGFKLTWHCNECEQELACGFPNDV